MLQEIDPSHAGRAKKYKCEHEGRTAYERLHRLRNDFAEHIRAREGFRPDPAQNARGCPAGYPNYSRMKAIERRALQSEAIGLCALARSKEQGVFY